MLQFRCSLQDARKLLFSLFAVEIILAVIFVADYVMGKPSFSIHVLFDLDGEACIPAWFSSMQLFLTGAVFLLAGRAPAASRPPPAFFLTLIGACFIFLSADEAGMIHERLRGLVKHAAAAMPQVNSHGAWISIYAVVGTVLLLSSYRHLLFMFKFFRRETAIIMSGFGIMCLGAVGLEIVSYAFLRNGATPLLYALEVALEEFFEMAGASVILYGVTRFAINRLQVPTMDAIPPAATFSVPTSAVADCSSTAMGQAAHSVDATG